MTRACPRVKPDAAARTLLMHCAPRDGAKGIRASPPVAWVKHAPREGCAKTGAPPPCELAHQGRRWGPS
eukprot:8664807-Pyramimonas_sp.AAC.1